MRPPERQIRAVYGDTTIRVYQAYSDEIADAAIAAQTLVPPFRRDRMTWIKPSFTWMMYRSGWATKSEQERILAIDITREGFHWALTNACLSHFDPAFHEDEETWKLQSRMSPVRIQWDPERSPRMGRLDHRSIQVGLSREAATRYVKDWIVRITDLTEFVRLMRTRVQQERPDQYQHDLPDERPYPLSPALQQHAGISTSEAP